MMDDCANLISVQKSIDSGSNESFFLVCPSPGSRSMSLVGKQELFNVKNMLFISNDALLVQFNNGRMIVLKVFGQIVE